VHGPRVKELHFFGHRAVGRDPAELAAEYATHFPRPEDGIAGEWTPSYMTGPNVPGQLAAAAPDARILVLLRDPIDRYRSGAFRRPEKAESAIRRGLYATQLARYLEFFPRERLLVLQYERCLREQEAELARTFEFLGVDPGFRPRSFESGGARSFGAGEELAPELRERLVATYEPEVRRLAELGFPVDLSLWPNFAHLGGGG
jgi:sulfotransferase family protein